MSRSAQVPEPTNAPAEAVKTRRQAWRHLHALPRTAADSEELEVVYGAGGFGPLDSDDIEAMIAAGAAGIPEGAR